MRGTETAFTIQEKFQYNDHASDADGGAWCGGYAQLDVHGVPKRAHSGRASPAAAVINEYQCVRDLNAGWMSGMVAGGWGVGGRSQKGAGFRV